MNRNLLLLLAVLAACASSGDGKAETPSVEAGRPEIGRNEAVYEVVDQRSRARVAFAEKTVYDSGRVILWVRDLRRQRALGYIDSNGRAFRFHWEQGRRKEEPEALGADTTNTSLRRIVGHETSVELVATSEKALGEEMLAAKRAATAPPAPEPAPAAGGGAE
jgi:hypothetical protein